LGNEAVVIVGAEFTVTPLEVALTHLPLAVAVAVIE
jgi:hypothetical protein